MKKGMEHILIVDDDIELCDLVREYLSAEDFQVDAVHNGTQGQERALSGDYALVILDLMLPGRNGLDVLREVRQRSSVPVLILTARGEDVDRIVGLEIGADDYLPKPFNPRELLARARAILRRTTHGPDTAAGPISVGDVELDPATRTVRRAGNPVELTSVEFSLLECLLRAAGTVVTREQLVNEVLGRKFMPYDRSVDMHVSKIRKKLGEQSDGSERIKAIRSVGYIYVRPGQPGS